MQWKECKFAKKLFCEMKLPRINKPKMKKDTYHVGVFLSVLNVALALLALYILYRWG